MFNILIIAYALSYGLIAAEYPAHIETIKSANSPKQNGNSSMQNNMTPTLAPKPLSEQQVDRLNKMQIQADSLGLERSKYSRAYSIAVHQSAGDSALAYRKTISSLLYETAYGYDPGLRYNGLTARIDTNRIEKATDEIISSGNWRKVLNDVEPTDASYKILKTQLRRYETLAEREVPTNRKNKNIERLMAYDLLPLSYSGEGDLKSVIKKFQTLVSLDTTGIADPMTATQLSVPISERIKQVKQALNYMRWISRLPEKRIIMVNIPATHLQIISRDGSPDIGMKVILGKVSWQTPIFAAYIYAITTYPYWIVPKSIAIKEILPRVKRNIGWLDASNIQVINSNGQIVPAGKIAWSSLSAYYFPYTFRQSTGCDNSLGVMMFNINSPYSVYLHDTNAKELFNNHNRFLSHGCVRVENAMLVAETLAGNEILASTIDELNSCLKDQKPKEIKLPQNIPLIVSYMLAGIENDQFRFYPDIYKIHK
jgi:hypothetical protein